MAQCSVCTAIIPTGSTECPVCVGLGDANVEVYELSTSQEQEPRPEWDGGAVYTLEVAVRCPHCQERVRTVRVLRMKRTQVSFTSPLPRGGRVLVCSACDGILTADLTAL
jgi:hypothetical protein